MPAKAEILVCNTGPLVALIRIGQVPLLSQLFQRVLVPSVVWQELMESTRLHEAVWIDPQTQGLEIISSIPPVDPLLTASLDAAEAAVLTLARHIRGSLALLDERKARHIAEFIYDLPVIGIGGLMLRARHRDVVPRIRPLLEAMVAQGYYLSDHFIERLCLEANELQLHEKRPAYGARKNPVCV